MKLKNREQAVINRRRKLWSSMGWSWPAERNDGGRHKTRWTTNKHDAPGTGFFRKNHSLSCRNHAICRLQHEEKIRSRRRLRRQSKKIILEELDNM